MRLDCIRILEATYAPVASEQAWVTEILAPFEPLARGLGVVATVFDLEGSVPRVRAWGSGSASAAVVRAFEQSRGYLARNHLAHLRYFLDPAHGVCCWTSDLRGHLPGPALLEARAPFAGTGVADGLGVLAAEPGAPTVVVSIPCERRFPVSPRTVQQLTRVSAHLSTALRLRARLEDGAPDGEGPGAVEAVLDPAGRIRHAAGPARARRAQESLALAVRAVERARGRLRQADPDEALALWRALLEGRWTVVERTEADGKRLLLARRNPPGFRHPEALAPGERDVLGLAARGLSNKYIGYLLGVAASTVSTRLATALRKLGVASRREAIALLGGGVDAAREPAANHALPPV